MKKTFNITADETRPSNLYLQYLAEVSSLLQKPSDVQKNLHYVLTRLRAISGVSRSYLFENHLSPSGVLLTSIKYEVCAPGISSQINNPDLHNLDAEKFGVSTWRSILESGDIIRGAVEEFSEIEQEFLQKQQIYWIMILPLLVEGRFWGFIGFDVCQKGVSLSYGEIALLETAAHVISASIERSVIEDERKSFNRLLASLAASGTLENMIELVAEQTDQIFKWDAHYLAVQCGEQNTYQIISLYDDDNGTRKRFVSPNMTSKPCPIVSPVLEGRPLLLNRKPQDAPLTLNPFGNKNRVSSSLMFVPIRSSSNIIGVISVQSYTPNKYNKSDLDKFFRIADAIAPVLERVFAEQKRRESDQQMRMIVESIPAIIFSIALQRPFGIFITPNVESITGYKPDDFVNNSNLWMEIIHPEDRPGIERDLSFIEQKYIKPGIFEFRIITREGKIRWIRGQLAFGQNLQGEPARLDGIAEDITERVKAEQELQNIHQIYRRSIETASGVPYRLNYKTNKYDYIGDGCEELLGIAREHFSPEALRGIIKENIVQGAEEDLNTLTYIKAVHDGEFPQYKADIRIITPHGQEKWLSDSSIIIRDEKTGEPEYAVGILHDITHRKKIEEALHFRLDFEKLITSISASFIHIELSEISAGIKRAMEQIGEFAGVDCICIFGLNEQNNAMLNLFRWLADEITLPKVQDILLPVERLSWWLEKLNHYDVIYIPRLSALPPNATEEKRWLEERGVKSCIAVPMISKGSLFGFLEFDSIKVEKEWSRDFINLLKIVGEIFVNAYERKRVEEALLKSEERYALAVRAANDGLWDWNLLNNEIYLSPRWKSMLGYEEHEISNNSDEWFQRVHPDDIDKMTEDLSAHLNGVTPHFENEHRILQKDGTYRWVHSRGLAIRDISWKAYRMVGSQSDIHVRKMAEEQLLHGAFHDELTGLPNRALFIDRLEQIIARASRYKNYRFAVMFLDLDRFKNINDSLGHIVGDKLLLSVAQRLDSSMRPGDTVARIGGDEFTILIEDIEGPEITTRIAERILNLLAQPYEIDEHEVFITASIGIAISNPEYRNPEILLRDADTAMYRAKAYGRSRYVLFDETMHAHTFTHWQTEMDLRRAVNRKEFLLHYQPIINLQDNKMAGYEALLRWNHPQQGLLMATKFISVIEDMDLIMPIGEWVFTEACRQTSHWHKKYSDRPPLPVCINLFSRQFMQPDLVDFIKNILHETGLDPRLIKIEITERVIMENTEFAIEMMKQLKNMNLQLLVDDFGTGYSSLSYIQNFPVDMLKIDRSFVNRMSVEEESMGIIQAIIMMARSLGIKVLAEGVENGTQVEKLKSLKCDYAQGYYYSDVLSPEQMENLFEQKNKW